MTISKRIGLFVIATAVVVGVSEMGAKFEVSGFASVISSAEARVGRPLTPVSVAGSARRTGRRTARRTAHRY